MPLETTQAETLAIEANAFARALPDPAARARYERLAAACIHGAVPADLISALETMLELVLDAGRPSNRAILQAIFAQPVGQVGPPVQSQFGFHVIKVTSRKTLSFDEAKSQIAQRLQQGNSTKLTDWLRQALTKARVTVNPKFGKFDKNQQTPGVVPPQAPKTATTAPGLVPPGGNAGGP